MAKYKPYSYAQGKFIAIRFDKQIQPGTLEYALNHLIDHELDLSIFDSRFVLANPTRKSRSTQVHVISHQFSGLRKIRFPHQRWRV